MVINPTNGNVEQVRVFDTYKSSHQLQYFISKPENIPESYIIVAACQDDITKNLSHESK